MRIFIPSLCLESQIAYRGYLPYNVPLCQMCCSRWKANEKHDQKKKTAENHEY